MSEKESKIKRLFHEIQQGNRNAFNELFALYYPRMVIFAKQYTKQLESAEEISSELFVKLWLKRALLSIIIRPEVYLYVSVKNACLNLIRSNQKQSILFTEETSTTPEADHENYSVLEDKELKKLLDAAIALLPDQRKIIFRLIKEDGLKTSEVAEILGLSKRTVENQLYKAIKTLAEAIGDYLGYDPQARSQRKHLSKLSTIFLMV